MSTSRISLRQARIVLHVAICWQVALVLVESQRGWRIVEYMAWLLPAVGLFVAFECVFVGITMAINDQAAIENAIKNVGVRTDLQALRFRSSVVAYVGSLVVFTREAFVASLVYALARVLVGPLHRRRAAWMVVDAAMLLASLVYLALGELDPFEFSAVLTVMVSLVTVAIYQDDTSR